MIRNALAAMLMASPEPRPSTMALYLASEPVTHPDGTVTWNPPARYDHTFDGDETIYRLPQSEIQEACRQLFAQAGLDIKTSPRQHGCAVYSGKNGVIIAIDRPFMGATPEAVIRHERGHLNGWPQDHRD